MYRNLGLAISKAQALIEENILDNVYIAAVGTTDELTFWLFDEEITDPRAPMVAHVGKTTSDDIKTSYFMHTDFLVFAGKFASRKTRKEIKKLHELRDGLFFKHNLNFDSVMRLVPVTTNEQRAFDAWKKWVMARFYPLEDPNSRHVQQFLNTTIEKWILPF